MITYAGWLIFLMILLSITTGLTSTLPAFYAGIVAWLAAALVFHRVSRAQKIQIVIMITIGLCGILLASPDDGIIALLKKAISTNHALLAMLAAVSFLRLMAQPHGEQEEPLPSGTHGFFRTLFGVHIFGAIINLSAILIVGDRLSSRKPLTLFQGLTLSRGFSLAALWSPFFAAMGIALTHAPGANLIEMVTHGLPIACIGLLVATIGLKSAKKEASYEGYPWQFTSLWLPALLAAAIILTHRLYPAISILTLIALFSLGITFLTLSLRYKKKTPRWISGYITHSLPKITGELTLFMAAGVLAVGISALINAYQYSLPIDQFGANEASLLLSSILIFALFGIHPIITISAASTLLINVDMNPNLLGITFLMGWALGISASPLSAIHLTMQGRYGLSAWQLLRGNLPFIGLMLAIDILALHFYYSIPAS